VTGGPPKGPASAAPGLPPDRAAPDSEPLPAGRAPGPVDGATWVLGVDSGGSGVRVALADAHGGGPRRMRQVTAPPRTGGAGIDADGLLAVVLPAVRELLDEAGAAAGGASVPVLAVAVGAAGMATLGDDLRAKLPDALGRAAGARRAALAADAVTAYAGALGERPGAVVAAGTGLIALGTDPHGGGWRRADGWGHLLGDCGGGAWIGRAGMEAAFRAYDGRRGGSETLLAALEGAFGPASGVPGRLYPRPDRPAVLASFAPEVARCAGEGDQVALRIIHEAGTHIAEAAAAVCPGDAEGIEVACTGGLFGMGELLLGPVREALRGLRPQAVLVEPEGDPLDGALRIATALTSPDGLSLPVEPPLLQVLDL
jgi:N-acetylglucosamine kinase-like BadF-type ATPase